MQYQIESLYKPSGDQPEAIKQLVEGIERGDRLNTIIASYSLKNIKKKEHKLSRLYFSFFYRFVKIFTINY